MTIDRLRGLRHLFTRANIKEREVYTKWNEAIISEVTFPIKFLCSIKGQNFTLYGVFNTGENPHSGKLSIFTNHTYGPDYKKIVNQNLESHTIEEIQNMFPEVNASGLLITHSVTRTSKRVVIQISSGTLSKTIYSPDKDGQIKEAVLFTKKFNNLFHNDGITLSPCPPYELAI